MRSQDLRYQIFQNFLNYPTTSRPKSLWVIGLASISEREHCPYGHNGTSQCENTDTRTQCKAARPRRLSFDTLGGSQRPHKERRPIVS